MLELHLALKYLKISRKNLSSGLIAIASTGVIALVVALLLAFFSITATMERRWLEKITALSAPLRITPTSHYINSYYYQADSAAENSNFTLLSLGEKMAQKRADPTDSEKDDLSSIAHLPKSLGADGKLRHLARELKAVISDIDHRELSVTGGGMRLRLIRDEGVGRTQSFLSAVPYFFAVDAIEPRLGELVVEPTSEDFDNLLRSLLSQSGPTRTDDPQSEPRAENEQIERRVAELVQNLEISKLKTGPTPWRLPSHILPKSGKISGWKEAERAPVFLTPPRAGHFERVDVLFSKGFIEVAGHRYEKKHSPLVIGENAPLRARVGEIRGERWRVDLLIQGESFSGFLPIDDLHIAKATVKKGKNSLFATRENGGLVMPQEASGSPLLSMPMLLPKTFREKGVRLGDLGYCSYQASGISGSSEQRLESYVAGFYDPGLSPIASRIILIPRPAVLAITSEGALYDFDQTLGNGLLLWGKTIGDTQKLKAEIARRLKEADLDTFFQIEAFTDYEFIQPFLKQFQSDRQLFTLISGLVLVVACCNVFSFLILLVNDKRADVAILRTMGATKGVIIRTFCFCALAIGITATAIGTGLAALFLAKLPELLNILSFLQNHPAFSPDIFGVSGSLTLDPYTLLYTVLGVPMLSLFAGWIAARRAASFNPTEVLKS